MSKLMLRGERALGRTIYHIDLLDLFFHKQIWSNERG